MTGRECLNIFTNNECDNFIRNFIRLEGAENYPNMLNKEYLNMAEFICDGFSWISSDEGSEYWMGLYHKYLGFGFPPDIVTVPKKATWKMERFKLV